MMKKTILGILMASIMLTTVFGTVSMGRYVVTSPDDRSGENDLPDLICEVGIVKIYDNYFIEGTITNVGDAATDAWTINVWGSPPIIYSLYKLGLIDWEIAFWWGTSAESTGHILGPGESYSFISLNYLGPEWWPPLGQRFVIVIKGIADPDNKVEESNENNNEDLFLWWLPMVEEVDTSSPIRFFKKKKRG